MRFIRLQRFAVVAAALAALALPAIARADAVTQWNIYASDAIVTTAGQPPAVSALSYAIVQGAVYDAVNAIDGTHRAYVSMPRANPWDSKDAAVAAAAFKVLEGLFPGQHLSLQARYDQFLTGVADIPAGAKQAGIDVGNAAAQAMLDARAGDGRFGAAPFVPAPAIGIWRPTPPFNTPDPAPWVGNVTPFVVPSAEMLRTKGPNALSSHQYAKDYNEVKTIGSISSTTRTADQTEAAIFWQSNGAFWNTVTRGISAERGLDLVTNARLFAMEDLAAADGFIGCYNDKYHWLFWRPITAIREGDFDGNPRTDGDPNWTPLFDPATAQGGPPLTTPPFPDHPSAHGCASSAIVHTLQRFFHTDRIGFSAFSIRTGTTRSWNRLSSALDEIVDARVWGGIHFRTADEQGAELGKEVARYLRKHYFQRNR
jgi:hypothetical protein